jgi:hypothetical protein
MSTIGTGVEITHTARLLHNCAVWASPESRRRRTVLPAQGEDAYRATVMRRSIRQSDARDTAAAAVVVALTLAMGNAVFAAPPTPPGDAARENAEPMWVRTFPLDDSRHVLLIVDPILRHVAIYHVDTVSGTLTLKSSRDISGDLRLGDFNAQEPKPATLRKMLEMHAPAAASRPAP